MVFIMTSCKKLFLPLERQEAQLSLK